MAELTGSPLYQIHVQAARREEPSFLLSVPIRRLRDRLSKKGVFWCTMKTMKLIMFLLVIAFLSAACLASPANLVEQPEVADQDQWQTYTSQKFQLRVRFPSTWQVIEPPTTQYPTAMDQVWFVSETLPLPQTGARADIVLIFTREDPSSAWEAQYFDDYQSDAYWLGEVQARWISGINKESRSSEIVVLAKIGDYYLQALPNHGEASLEYFDAVISSIRFDPAQATMPLPSETSIPESLDEKSIIFKEVSFTYLSTLAEGAAGKVIPAYLDPSRFVYDDIPEHMRFDFSDPYTTRGAFAGFQAGSAPWLRLQHPESLGIQPQIFIFPTLAYAAINTQAGERIEALRTLLEMGSFPVDQELPVLPLFNSAQDIRVHVASLEFHGGRGLRFITRYSQEAAPVVNPDLFYTFQGLTADGSLYVAAFFPLYIPSLPDQAQVDDWVAFNQGYQDYLADISSNIELLGPDDLEPDLETLDALIRSIVIGMPGATR